MSGMAGKSRAKSGTNASISDASSLLIRNVEEFAQLDLGRQTRRGIPEIIFAENKSPQQTARIGKEMAKALGVAIITRVSEEHVKTLRSLNKALQVEVHELARIVVLRKASHKIKKTGGKVAVLTAGTADIPVAEEAKIVSSTLGCEVTAVYDVGVAGLHRLLKPLKEMTENVTDVYVVVAGMEGALPSVVAGLVDAPVIGVPTSTGYGYGGRGEGALMAMLQSCAPGLAVVNIDNGVGAGALAALIANRIAKARK